MILLLPLSLATALARLGAKLLVRRGVGAARPWDSWSAALAAGVATVYVATGVTHFVEPQRSGLEAIVPSAIPWPGAAVTASGIAEFAIAVGLLAPKTRRWAAIASIALLIALFPSNVVAASGVDHPAAPSAPLLPRPGLQVALLLASAAALSPSTARPFPARPSTLRRSSLESEG